MGTLKRSEITPHPIAAGRTRYLANTPNVMVVVVDFNDGPAARPDPPHSHPHEQASYVAAGELVLHMDGEKIRLKEGDLFTVPSGVPHAVQTLTPARARGRRLRPGARGFFEITRNPWAGLRAPPENKPRAVSQGARPFGKRSIRLSM